MTSPLPMAAADLVPHARPMLAIDTLLAADAATGRVALRARPDAWYMRPDGRWDEIAGIELISQAAAALNGHDARSRGSPPPAGFLAEVRQYTVTDTVSAGDALTIEIRRTTEFGGFAVMTGELRRGDTPVATAELTFWKERQST